MIQFNRKTGLPYSGVDLLTAQRILEDGALRLTFSQCINALTDLVRWEDT